MSKALKTNELGEKKQVVTAKTLKAWSEQGRRIIDESLLNEEDSIKLLDIQKKVIELWVSKLF